MAGRLIQGILQVYTGHGKGKTTAAAGLCVRALGAGLRVAFVQFVKGGRESAELEVLRRLGARVERPARTSTGLLRGGATPADRAAGREAEAVACALLEAGEHDVVVLDELCAAWRHDLVDRARILQAIVSRAPHIEVVVTGRDAPSELLEHAALVSSIVACRHPLAAGLAARRGIDF